MVSNVISVLLMQHPYHSDTLRDALKQIIIFQKNGHTIESVFLYQDAVYLALPTETPADEFNLNQAWVDWAQQQDIPLLCCSTSAIRRGLYHESLNQNLIQSPFEVSGLGAFYTSVNQADRLVQF